MLTISGQVSDEADLADPPKQGQTRAGKGSAFELGWQEPGTKIGHMARTGRACRRPPRQRRSEENERGPKRCQQL